MSGTTLPTGPTSLQGILPAYVFQEYSDDDNIQAFFVAFNQFAQVYQDWFNTINLPIYTQPQIAGSLLDWVAEGIYGIRRPSLALGKIAGLGLLNTYELNAMMLNSFISRGTITDFTVSDDIFKRIITWFFFKGDGQRMAIGWLKRRIMRFLVGTNGTAPNIDNTYPVGISFGSSNSVVITITLSPDTPITSTIAEIFQAAVQTGAVNLPFQFSFTVLVINATLGLANNGGVLQVITPVGWPTSATGLPAGAVWDAGGAVYVIPGITPNPFAPPIFFNSITAAGLLALGGGNLPLIDPVNRDQIWNNGGIACVSLG